MRKANSSYAFVLNRRAFLAAIGSTTVLISSCSFSNEATVSDPVADAIENVVQSKQALISDANRLSATEPTISAALQVVIDQNLLHIEALSPYLSTSAAPLPTESVVPVVNLPALTTRCAVFSTNNLATAISLSDPELSRVLALIAGSEMQHHALLSGLIT
jgi:hypothetical protein